MTHDLWKRDAASPTNPQQTCPTCGVLKGYQSIVGDKPCPDPFHGTGTVQPDYKFTVPTEGYFHEQAVINGETVVDRVVKRPIAEPEAGSEITKNPANDEVSSPSIHSTAVDMTSIHEQVAEWLNDNFADLQPWEEDDEPLEDKYWQDFDRRIRPLLAPRGITESDQPRSSDGPAATPSSTSKSEEIPSFLIRMSALYGMTVEDRKRFMILADRLADRRVREALEHLREISRPYPTTSKGELYNLIESTLAQLDKQEDTQ